MRWLKKLGAYKSFVIISIVICIVFNILARVRVFCDFYTDHIYRIWANTYGRFMGLFSFSVGEFMIIIMGIFVIVALLLGIALIFFKKKNGYKIFCKKYYKFFSVLVLITIILMTFNCSIPYNCTRIKFDKPAKDFYEEDEVVALYNFVVGKCNELSEVVERDANGIVVIPGNYQDEVKKCLKKLSDDYPRMRGYYPNAKPIINTFFMSQTGTIGIYFPFSLEANYSRYLTTTYLPSVIGHELSHLKGYMYEDEANFMAYLACIRSEDKSIQYSGYLSVLSYVVDLIPQYDNGQGNLKGKLTSISQLVIQDDSCYTNEAREEMANKKPVVDTKVVKKLDDKFTETYMTYYNVTPNYSEVALLLLNYYDGKLY